MGRIFDNYDLTIGNTPLVRINRISEDVSAEILAKVEGRNPAFSVKCRLGAALIWAAEKEGILKPGHRDVTIIEPTSGNTGIALAFVAAVKGYPIRLTMPETYSIERRRMLESYGAKLELTDGRYGMRGAIERAEEIRASAPDRYFMPHQFSNPANPDMHYRTTGPEIWSDTAGHVDAFVAGIGTGGTITGAGRYLKEHNPNCHTIGVEPATSPVLTQLQQGQISTPGPHKIQGIGAGFKPEILDLDVVDELVTVTNEEAIHMAKRLSQEEGISCGISSGAAMVAAHRQASKENMTRKRVVVILPDAGERYLSSALFEEDQ